MKTVRVDTGARIHLGLIAPMAREGRRFGGAGLMLEDPGLKIQFSCNADGVRVNGPLADRARAIAEGLPHGSDVAIDILSGPADHSGLGTGTQLSLSIAAGLNRLQGQADLDAKTLASLTGRGDRSAIGVYGFEEGGFLVDAGRLEGDTIAPLVARAPIPEAWRFVLAFAETGPGRSGKSERSAFADLKEQPEIADALCRLLITGLLPAIQSVDVRSFGRALAEYGRRAGEIFSPVQGGVFASPRISEIVAACEAHGAEGATQSSWGPAVCAAVADEGRAQDLADALVRECSLDPRRVLVTKARNQGAEIRETVA